MRRHTSAATAGLRRQPKTTRPSLSASSDIFLYVVVFIIMDLLLCKNILYLLCKSPDLGQSTISGGWMNILRLLTLLPTSSSSPTDHRTGRTDLPQHAVG